MEGQKELVAMRHSRKRSLTRRRRTPPVVLLYHRVAELEFDPWEVAVSPGTFESQLAMLSRRFKAVSLGRLRADLVAGRLEPRTVAVSFDDGYADNLTVAKPLLERFGVPATVFVVTGMFEGRAEFWWDALDRIVFEPETLPERFSVDTDGRQLDFELGPEANLDGAERVKQQSWRAWQPPPTPRHELYLRLRRLIRPLRPAEREHLVSELHDLAGVPADVRPTHRTLSAEEARELAAGDLVELGAHTVTHPVLASMPPEEQRWELQTSRQSVEELARRPAPLLSYPYGGPEDVSSTTVGLARELGFEAGCVNVGGAIRAGTDPLRLPRVYVRNLPAEKLEEAIARAAGRA
jgi:peptidoglycan/xylan/chitin deacetylase (PgdA/CDA1 family)